MSTFSITSITPIYDRDTSMLADALDSILAQTHPIDEVIVVDDGSAEPVAPWVESRYGDRVRVLRIEHAGIGAARNAAVEIASGSLLAFLDSDDVWALDKTERQLAVLRDEPDVDAVYGRARQFHDPATSAAHRERHPIRDEVIDAWLSTAQLIRTDAFHRIGPYWESPTGVDIDWMMRARDAGLSMKMLDEVVYLRRIHETNIGITSKETKDATMMAAVRASLERRRAAARAEAGATT